MADALEHRGPDERGVHIEPGIGLAIARLKIIDLVTGGQPMTNEDGSVWVVLNGEIYNFRELRQSLASRGHSFHSESDTECIVHAYEEYGDDCPRYLRGMFAFALWDGNRRRMLIARDRLGKKPLIYCHGDGELAFASEFQSLLRAPQVPRQVDRAAVADYLAYGYVPAPASIYRDVRKLLPGEYLVWERGKVSTRSYWRLEFLPKLKITEAEALVELEAKLREAVRLRLLADVPLGALLSGGVDSSVVVAIMAQEVPGKVKTFSIGFEDAAFNELDHARRVADRYATDHHEYVVKPDAADVLPKLVRHYGEPYADSSAIPTFYVSKLARTQVGVALNGDGGDEAFAGYGHYGAMWPAELMHALPASSRWAPAVARLLAGLPGAPGRVRLRIMRLLPTVAFPAALRYDRWMCPFWDDPLEDVLEPSFRELTERSRSRAVARAFEASEGLPLTDRMLATDFATALPNDLLVKMDIASMANSLETRSPLLDQEVVSFAAQLPVELKLAIGYRPKYLLKRLAATLLPSQNIDRPKMGFGVPVGSWLRGPLRELGADALLSQVARNRGYVRPPVVQRLWEDHQAGRRDHTPALWTLLMLELWHREFLD